MRYRIKRGKAAAKRVFCRPQQGTPPAPQTAQQAAPPRAADCGNPYFRCYGKARRLDDLKKR